MFISTHVVHQSKRQTTINTHARLPRNNGIPSLMVVNVIFIICYGCRVKGTASKQKSWSLKVKADITEFGIRSRKMMTSFMPHRYTAVSPGDTGRAGVSTTPRPVSRIGGTVSFIRSERRKAFRRLSNPDTPGVISVGVVRNSFGSRLPAESYRTGSESKGHRFKQAWRIREVAMPTSSCPPQCLRRHYQLAKSQVAFMFCWYSSDVDFSRYTHRAD